MGHVGMKYSLASRELICDSVETMFMAHQFDGCVLVPNCDKIVPGMVMAAVRMNVPAVVLSLIHIFRRRFRELPDAVRQRRAERCHWPLSSFAETCV